LKNLSNNPWVIVGLAIFALIYLVVSIGGLILDDEAQASAPIDVEAPDSLVFSAALQQTFDIEKPDIAWLNDVSRDPFGGDELSVRGSANDVLIKEKTLKLNAIFFGESTRMAVVDQQLIREGDVIGSYRVITIKRNQVVLAGDNKRLVLEALL